jgi:hypothetical protein
MRGSMDRRSLSLAGASLLVLLTVAGEPKHDCRGAPEQEHNYNYLLFPHGVAIEACKHNRSSHLRGKTR